MSATMTSAVLTLLLLLLCAAARMEAYGNVWGQKSSAGPLCPVWEQSDSCAARGQMAARAS